MFPSRFVFESPPTFQPRLWQELALRKYQDMRDDALGQPFTFLLQAGCGSGKSLFAAMVASDSLNEKFIERIVYVCPNNLIANSIRADFVSFGMHLAPWNNRKHAQEGERKDFQGVVMTYAMLTSRPELHKKYASSIPTLVILDEPHHLADNMAWGDAAIYAFGNDSCAIAGMTATPYRVGGRMPFFASELCSDGFERYTTHYSYPLGRAIIDDVCRKPQFLWYDIKGNYAGKNLDFDGATQEQSDRLLQQAVRPGCEGRRRLLSNSLASARALGGKVIIFVGGDSSADTSAVDDATFLLPDELCSLGIPRSEICCVTSSDSESANKVRSFGASGEWIMVTVNMMSEGANVPSLQTAIFLSSVTAPLTTEQRVGRVLRGKGIAEIHMYKHPAYMSLAAQIEKEQVYYAQIRDIEQANPLVGNGGGKTYRRRPRITVEDAFLDGITIDGVHINQDSYDKAAVILKQSNLSVSADRVWTVYRTHPAEFGNGQ